MKSIHFGQLAVAIGTIAIGVFFLIGSFMLPDAAGYSTVGPAVMPRLVGIALIGIGGILLYEVVRGGFRNHDEAAERALRMKWSAFGWITAGILSYGLLIEWAGFIFSSIILFVCTARSFGSRRWVQNALIALVLAVLVFSAFNYGLGLTLPMGWLKGIL